MKKISVLSLAASCVAAFMIPAPFAQGQAIPTVPALATSENVEVIGNVPGPLLGLDFSGDYAYGTAPSGLTIFDISEPANPTVAGELPIPHFENEDVDICGDLLIIANDALNPEAPLYVIDISDPMLPTIAGTIRLGSEGANVGAGHIANFVGNDCKTLWVDGGEQVEVVSLEDPAKPVSLGAFTSEASKSEAFTVTHDTEWDGKIAWNVGGGGAAGYKLTKDPLKPKLVAGGAADSKAPVTVNCSSHWFDERNGVAAVGWYEQGTRFIDVTNPKDIRQVGYYLPLNGSTWASYWSPTDPTGTIVYTADAYRGLDVLKIDNSGLGAETTTAPVPDSWFGSGLGIPAASPLGLKAHPVFGWACPIPLGRL